MSVRKIVVKEATLRIQTGFLPYIGKYKEGVLRVSDLPVEVDIEDPDTKQIHHCNLIEIVPFTHGIPTVFSLLAEGKRPEQCEEELLKRNKAENVNQLALYLYEPTH